MGDKYIIELEDKPFHKEDGDFLYRAKGFNSLVFDMTGIGKLTPYTEPDLEQVKEEAHDKGYDDAAEKKYTDGLTDAWEAARKIWEYDTTTLREIFGDGIMRMDWFMHFTAAEVIEKLKAYEQEQDAEIKIGNEVKAFEKKPFIVTGFGYGDNEEDVYCYGFVTENGIPTSAKKNSCVRTGRHFPEIAAVLEKMRNESNVQIDT